MPEPEPQPPQPRPIPFWKWLLMLVPSVPMMASPLIAKTQMRLPAEIASDEMIGTFGTMFLFSFAISAGLSVILGFLLEQWRYGTVAKKSRAISYGAEILVINFLIAFAGCTVGAIGTIATHP